MHRLTIKTIIIDDNTDAIELLKRLLEKNSAVEVCGTATDTPEAIELINESDPDLIFLDVELPSMSGIEFCPVIQRMVRPETKIIFYTAYDKYMLDAIRRQAFDYLLKPPSEQELNQIMMRYYENKLSNIQPVAARPDGQPPLILVVNAMNEHLTLRADDIAFFRYNAARKLWEVVCMNHQSYTLRHRTTADIIQNYSADFVQIHKRYIVNVNHIKMIQEGICRLDGTMADNTELRISKSYKRDLMDTFYSM